MSPKVPQEQLTSFAPKPVDIPAIERELAELWQQGAEAGETVTRACMSNLIIFCANGDQAAPIPDEVATIIRHHPSRILLLVGDGGKQEPGLEAHVSAHCYLASGGRQVCSEHVTISASGGAARRLPSCARALLIGDLPTALWWVPAQGPSPAGELFGELAAMADHVIYDSIGWPDPARSVVATANWAASEKTRQVISDLAWRRLKPWQRLISQVLDPDVLPGALKNISEVTIEHGPHALPQSWLLIGWMACRLGWRTALGKVAPGVEVRWEFESEQGPLGVTVRRLAGGDATVHSVVIRWKEDQGSREATFHMSGRGRLAVRSSGSSAPERGIAVPAQSRAALVAGQLPDLVRDLLFLDTLQVSRTMAEALL